MEFVKRKAPVKKETIRKESVRPEIKVARLTPKTMPVIQPRTAVQQTRVARAVVAVPSPIPRQAQRSSIKSSAMKAVMYSSRPTKSNRVNAPRSFASVSDTSSTKGSIVRGTPHFKLNKLRVVRAGGKLSSRATRGRMVPVQTGVHLASLASFPSPREVPNIRDKGALKSYIGRVQRSVEGAKHYPEASRRAGRYGKLKVQFTILKNGEVDNVKLLTKTPYPNLNREAMAAVKRAAPFSGFPDSIMEQSLKVVLPFRFELN